MMTIDNNIATIAIFIQANWAKVAVLLIIRQKYTFAFDKRTKHELFEVYHNEFS
jgi:hypothetical protein